MLVEDIKKFKPFNKQEERDKALMLSLLNTENNLFTRDNKLAHFTASAWVVNKTHDSVLMAYHNIYQSWSWLGGHADGEENLLKVALKEVQEESSLKEVVAVSDGIFSLEVLTVDGHIKNNEYISSHLHLNVTYLIEANDKDIISVKPDENSDIKWFKLNEAVAASTEPWFRDNIYKKLNQKLLS